MASEKDQEKLAALLAHEIAEPGSTTWRADDIILELWEITSQGLARSDQQ